MSTGQNPVPHTPGGAVERVPNRRRWAAVALGGGVLAASALLGSPVAHADTSTPAGCAAAGKVWLEVRTYDGYTLANQCVGNPSTGTDALTNAHLRLERNSSGMFCRIGGYPRSEKPCLPDYVFVGQYWQYYHLTNGKWSYSNQGGDSYHPKAGGVEGWCYNGPQKDPKQQVHCDGILPVPDLTKPKSSPSPTASKTTSAPASTPKPTAAHSTTSGHSTGASGSTTTPQASSTSTSTSTSSAAGKASSTTSRASSPSASATSASTSPSASASGTPGDSTTPSPDASSTDSSASPSGSVGPLSDTSSAPKGSSKGPWGVAATVLVLAAGGGGYAWWRHTRGR